LSWSNGSTASSITVTNTATYTVKQTINGCISPSGSGNSAPKAVPVAPTVTVQNNCGSSTLTASNFTSSLSWSNGATASSITVSNAATYTVTQTVNGCISPAGSGTATIVKSPIVTCPSSITVNTDNGVCTAKANFSASATGTPAPTIVYKVGSTTITPGSYPFPVGKTTVNVSATNSCGTVTCSFTVTVVSNKPCNNDSRKYVTDQNPQPGKEQTNTTAANSGNNSKGSLFSSDVFKVIVAPNPSTTDFRLHVQSSSNAPINILVTDAVGRVLAVITSVHSNSEVTFGGNYRGGSYFAEVVQGANHKTVKLIKL
jgi:hypothetical protein